MGKEQQHHEDLDDKKKQGADVDVDAEHNKDVSRRSSNAGLRREAGAVQMKPAAMAADPKAAHDKADRKSYNTAHDAMLHLAKEMHRLGPEIREWTSSDTTTDAGAEPAIQAIAAIHEMVLSDAQRIGSLIAATDPSERRTLSPDVRVVQGALVRFFPYMTLGFQWVQRMSPGSGYNLSPTLIQHETDALTAKIGIDGPMEPDTTVPEGDETALLKSMVNGEVDALEAAVDSVEAGNEADKMRITLHARHLDNFAKEHGLRIKTQHKKLEKVYKKLNEIRSKNPSDMSLNEAHNHIMYMLNA
jgi:hypothetical protein